MPPWGVALIAVGWGLTVITIGFVIRVMVRLAQHDTMAKGHEELLKLIPEMREDIAEIKSDNKVFWQVIGPHMSHVIQSPHAVNRDHLIRKLDEGTLTYDEGLQLNSMLGHAFDEETDKDKKEAYAFKLIETRRFLLHEDSNRIRQQRRQEGGDGQCSSLTQTSSAISPISRLSSLRFWR
jgi:hypothetical protein